MSDKFHTIVFIIIFFGNLVLTAFMPEGLLIFMLTALPIMLSRNSKTFNTSVDLTMLIFLFIVTLAAYSKGFDLDYEQKLFIFCPIVGYLIVQVIKSKYEEK